MIVSISNHNDNQINCKILVSLLQEGKPSKIASKLGFLAPGLEKWTKVVQARILVKNGRSSTPDSDGDFDEQECKIIIDSNNSAGSPDPVLVTLEEGSEVNLSKFIDEEKAKIGRNE